MKGKNYTSARLITKGKGDWQYGKIEVRARLPKGLGTAGYLDVGKHYSLRWPDDGEIDIMEHVGFNQDSFMARFIVKNITMLLAHKKLIL
jgi:beta-glucanase (GH16 family)